MKGDVQRIDFIDSHKCAACLFLDQNIIVFIFNYFFMIFVKYTHRILNFKF